MDLEITVAIAVGAAVLAGLFGWLGARKPDPARGPRLAPYRFLMLAAAAVVLMMLVNLANLARFHTGR